MSEKDKKKKLTLTVSSKKTHVKVPNYTQSKGKTSVVIEKKPSRKWGGKKFQPKDIFNKPKLSNDIPFKKPTLDKSFNIRKIAEERATRRFNDSNEKNLQNKKSSLGREKTFTSRKQNKLTLSKALDDETFDGKERSLSAVKRARLKAKKTCDSSAKYFNHTNKNFSYKFEGIPKQNKIYNEKIFEIFSRDLIKEKKAELAASIQKIYEFYLIKILKKAIKMYKSDNLCLSGGCALNSSANGKIKNELEFKNIFIPYAPADGGGAIGSALVFIRRDNNLTKFKNLNSPYLGPIYNETDIINEINKIDKEKFIIKKYENKNELNEIVAEKISGGSIVGWFQDRIEFGARALGNRSILADPRNKNIKNIINLKIKKREDFRPFAPSILSEFKSDWFVGDNYSNYYMETVLKIKDEKKDIVPSIVHVDQTCRVQSVSVKNNLKFYNLIKSFYKLTDVPILLNTSFNENEPIVCSPKEALECFLRTQMDDITIDNFLITRKN